jgi:hypothetical protein
MTVVPFPNDHDGMQLQANITALTALLAVHNAGHPAKNAAAVKLDQLQRELVLHYVEHGRLNCALILSTMS